VKITYVLDYFKLTNKVLFKKVYFSHCYEDSTGNNGLSENNIDYLGRADITV